MVEQDGVAVGEKRVWMTRVNERESMDDESRVCVEWGGLILILFKFSFQQKKWAPHLI